MRTVKPTHPFRDGCRMLSIRGGSQPLNPVERAAPGTPRARRVHGAWRELGVFLTAAECAGCGAFESFLCGACQRALRADPVSTHTPRGLPVYAGLVFEGVAARVIRAMKQEGRTSLIRHLAPPLFAALQHGASSVHGSDEHPPRAPVRDTLAPIGYPLTHHVIVPVPTSPAAFRRRGYRVPDLLIRATGLRAVPLLRTTRRVDDQRHLGRAQRQRNVSHSMGVRASTRTPAGTVPVLLVDDVMTTGATLDEAARALREAGFRVPAAVTLAATPHRQDTHGKQS